MSSGWTGATGFAIAAFENALATWSEDKASVQDAAKWAAFEEFGERGIVAVEQVWMSHSRSEKARAAARKAVAKRARAAA